MIAFLILLISAVAYYFYEGPKIPKGKTIDKLVVYKSRRKMQAWSGSELLKVYTVALGKNPIGDKEFEGDNKTPEGTYYIDSRNPNSIFYKNLGISYPNETDKANAERLGKSAGGDIKIHGLRNTNKIYRSRFHRWKDWTAGCIAVTNAEMDELFAAVEDGAVIEIKN